MSIRQHEKNLEGLKRQEQASGRAASVRGLKLLKASAEPAFPRLLRYAASSYYWMRPTATSVCGLKLLVYAAISY